MPGTEAGHFHVQADSQRPCELVSLRFWEEAQGKPRARPQRPVHSGPGVSVSYLGFPSSCVSFATLSYSGQSSENCLSTKVERAFRTILRQPLILCMRNKELESLNRSLSCNM